MKIFRPIVDGRYKAKIINYKLKKSSTKDVNVVCFEWEITEGVLAGNRLWDYSLIDLPYLDKYFQLLPEEVGEADLQEFVGIETIIYVTRDFNGVCPRLNMHI